MEQAMNRQPSATPETSSEVKARINKAVFALVQEVLPLMGDTDNRDILLKQLDHFMLWLRLIPRPLTEKPWTYEEFESALAGLQTLEEDPRFGAFMDAFYEEYKENPEDELQTFYSDLFQNEEEARLDWGAVWQAVRANYQSWLENEYNDAYLKSDREEPQDD